MSFAKSNINKSVITSNSFTAPESLSHEEADRFIDYMVDQSFLKKNARVERMSAPTKTIAKVGIGKNILKPGKAAVDPGNTVGITTDQLTLETKEIIAVAEISDDSLEDNIEGDAFVDHLMRMIASQAANELEFMSMYGKRIPQPNEATSINQLVNGWLTIAGEAGHILNARDTGLFVNDDGSDLKGYITPDKLSRIVKTMPNKYRVNKQNLRFLAPDDIYQDYNDYLGARAVSTADPYLLGVGRLTYSNIPIQQVALMPTDRAVTVIGGASTTLSGNATVGSNTIAVTAATNITAGDYLELDQGTGFAEVVSVASISGTTITLTAPLQFDHAGTTGTVTEVTPDGCDMLLTDYRNLIFGIQRDIKWETERHARKRTTSFVMTMRVDTQVENPDAMVILKNLRVK